MRQGRVTGGLAVVVATVSRRGPWLVAIVFVALVSQAALDVWRGLAMTPGVPAAPVVAPVADQPQLVADVAAIAGRHLFGAAATGSADAPPPPTRAALVLGGVWYAPEADAYALIGEPGAAQRSYRVGDRLPGGVELTDIEVDHVVLRRDGRAETLALPRVPLQSRPTGVAHPGADRPSRRYR